MPLWLWIVIGFIAAVNFGAIVYVAASEITEIWRDRQLDRAFREIAAAHAERESAQKCIGRVPQDRSAA